PLPADPEPNLVGISSNHLGGGPEMNVAGFGVDNHGIARRDALDNAPRLPDRGEFQRPGHDRHVALAAPLLDYKSPQLRAIVVEELGRTHRARYEDGVGGELKALPCCRGAACQDAQQTRREVIEVAQPL